MHSVLIIGCGNIAGGFDADRPVGGAPLTHAGAYARHGGFHLRACVDPHAARREGFSRRWGADQAAESVAALEAAPGSFDVISICSPNSFHATHLEAALALKPRLIFCEKPVTATAAETEQWGARCAAGGVALAVNYTRRWAPDVLRLRDALDSGEWGEVRSVTGTYTKGIVHNGGHLVDLLHLLLGPMTLLGVGAPRFDFWEDDPSVPALLETAAGVPVHFAIADARDYALFEVVLVTTEAEIVMRDGGGRWSIRRRQPSAAFSGYFELGDPETVPGEYDQAMLAAIVNIAAVLDHGAPLASEAVNAAAAQRLCERIRDAASSAPTPIPFKPRTYS